MKRKSPEAEMGSRPNRPLDRPYRVGIVGAGGIAGSLRMAKPILVDLAEWEHLSFHVLVSRVS